MNASPLTTEHPPQGSPPRQASPRGSGPGPASSAARLGRWLLWPVAWLGLQLNLLVLGVLSVGWNLLALVLRPLLPRPLGVRLGRAMIAHGYALFWRIARASGMLQLEASVLDSLRDERNLVIVANHPSMLDAVMLVARLPRSFCIMKTSLMQNPLLGPGARLARYVRNDSAHGMIVRAVKELTDGGQLVLFPEGTRTTQHPVNPLHASFALIAKRARAPVQVVYIDTDSPYLGKGWPLWRLPPLPIRFAVRMGPRLQPGGDVQALTDTLHACFERELRPAAAPHAGTPGLPPDSPDTLAAPAPADHREPPPPHA